MMTAWPGPGQPKSLTEPESRRDGHCHGAASSVAANQSSARGLFMSAASEDLDVEFKSGKAAQRPQTGDPLYMAKFKNSPCSAFVGTLYLFSFFCHAEGLMSSIKSSGESPTMMMQMDTCANNRIPKHRLVSALRGGGPCLGTECKYVPALAWLEKYSLAQQTGFGFFSVVFVVVAEVVHYVNFERAQL